MEDRAKWEWECECECELGSHSHSHVWALVWLVKFYVCVRMLRFRMFALTPGVFHMIVGLHHFDPATCLSHCLIGAKNRVAVC